MLISYNWLKELIPDLAISPEEVAELLTAHSFETKIANRLHIDPKVIAGRVVEIEPHPKADRLKLVTVDIGTEKITVVCGASNVEEGSAVSFSPIGTSLLDENGHSFLLSAAKIRGILSPGMLNSPRELGLGNWHGGIYLLPEDTPIGCSLSQHILDDTILEADITPNRAHDCLGHLGLAREVAAITGQTVQELPVVSASVEKIPDWSITIQDSSDCARYLAALLTNVIIRPSPLWLQTRLWAMGLKPINNVVDVTNYVMFTTGNPTHAFDASKLPSREIVVRRAHDGETMNALDDENYTTSLDDLLITSGDRPVALAGIIGGRETEVTAGTKEILLEAANFRSYLIQQTSVRLNIVTESAARFKKDLSPSLADASAALAIRLLVDIAGANLAGVTDIFPRPAARNLIIFSPIEIKRIAGVAINEGEAYAILTRLGCLVKQKENEEWQVQPPPDRLDLTGPHDLVEEIIRIAGLEKISAKPPVVLPEPAPLPELVQWRELIRDLLVEQGLTESLNLSFDDEKILKLISPLYEGGERGGSGESIVDFTNRLSIANPPSPEKSFLRSWLWPSLVGNLLANKAEFTRKSLSAARGLFEIGTVFVRGETGKVIGVQEEEHVAAIFVGSKALAEAQDMVDQIVKLFGTTNDGSCYGQAYELPVTTKVVEKIKHPIAVLELNINQMAQSAETAPNYTMPVDREITKYMAPSKYPAVFRDLSILIDESVPAEKAQEIIERIGGKLVADVDLFDIYHPAKTDKQGLAWHIIYQSMDKTLTDEEVDALHNNIIAQLKAELDAELRE